MSAWRHDLGDATDIDHAACALRRANPGPAQLENTKAAIRTRASRQRASGQGHGANDVALATIWLVLFILVVAVPVVTTALSHAIQFAARS